MQNLLGAKNFLIWNLKTLKTLTAKEEKDKKCNKIALLTGKNKKLDKQGFAKNHGSYYLAKQNNFCGSGDIFCLAHQ